MLITKLAIKWKSSVFLLMFVFAIFGSIAYVSLPRESTPDIPIPYIMITTVYAGVAPADIESLITLQLEKELKGLKGVKQIDSYSAESVSNISIEFYPEVDTEMALQRVKDKVDRARTDLPDDLTDEPQVIEISTSDFPIMVITVAGNIPETNLKKIADDMQKSFEGVPGVLQVDLSGARDRQIQVQFDYGRLQSYGLSMNDLSTAVMNENINIPGGTMAIGRGNYMLQIPGEYKDPLRINDIVVATRDGKPIYLKDVATVKDTFEDRESYARINGNEAISLSIKKRAGANIISIGDEVKNVIAQYEEILPPAVQITMTTDQTDEILKMVHELENHLVTGLILVVLVLFFFLGATNSFFTALAIPFSMLMSFIIFQALGMTLNMLVLFSLIMALGMLVDDAIVIVENIFRHMQEGKNRTDASIAASEEVGWPVIASTLTKIFAFLPMAFWPGVVGSFMSYIPITLMITLTMSLFVALVFNPVICSTFMKVSPKKIGEKGELEFGKFMQLYMKTVDWALNHRAVTILLSIVFMILPIVIFSKSGLGAEFFPESDPQRIYIRANAPQGTNAETTNDMVLKFEDATKGENDIKLILGEVGGGVATVKDMGGTVTHLGRLTVEFIDFDKRAESSVTTMNRIRDRLGIFPGAEVVLEKETMGPPTGDPISIEISGPDVTVLGDLAAQIKEIIRPTPGLVDLKDDYIKSKPEFRVDIDREKAALLGLSTATIASTIRNAMYGLDSGKYREGEDEYDIKVRLPLEKRKSIDDIKNIKIATSTGEYVPISSVADINLGAGFGRISRVNFKRVVTVTANVSGRSSIEVLNDVSAKLANFETPAGYKISYTGEKEDQDEAVAFLSKAFSIAIFLILMVLMIEFNSIAQTSIILGTVLLSLGGVFWGLLITQTPFGIMMTGIGVISLAGVVVNNGIILIDYTNKLREKGYKMREAVIHGGAVRFRPVLLTAMTAILGMLPMATGYGISIRTLSIEKGAEMAQWWGPMANAIIFGLSFATVLTLVVVPVLYSFTSGGLHDKELQESKEAKKSVLRKIWNFIRGKKNN